MRKSPDIQDALMTICFHTFSYKGEEFFLWPGDGVMLVDAVLRHDYIESMAQPTVSHAV
jgi:ABC-type antimicrobial peptide transport system permease subunit